MHSLILLQSRSPGIGNGLTYDAANTDLAPGSLVQVTLRKKVTEGIVLAMEKRRQEEKEDFSLKPIEDVLSRQPLLTEAQLKLVRWMAGYYYCSLRGALVPFLPSGSWKSLLPKDIVGYRLKKPMEKGGKKQMMVMEYLEGRDWMPADEIKSHTGVSHATLKTLVKEGYIEEEARPPEDTPKPDYALLGGYPTFTPIQEQAYKAMKADTRPSLLFGITGSGKTEVYAAMIADMAAEGKQSILLVPEILLTEHSLDRFERLFDRNKLAILHSRLTPAARRLEWMRIHRGEAALIIGSRSALFAPCKNLGLVIIDEEHEWTYKNEQTPRYHARETAETLCRYANAKLVLGSATPSLESWERTKNGQYHLAKISERYQNRPLPTVRIVDLANVKFGSLYPFSPPLLQAMEERLQKGEQTVLFLNRRGIASSILCLDCRRRIVSQETQLPFTLHKSPSGKPYLLDHFSGVTATIPERCPHCQSTKLTPVGAGTQKLEEIVQTIFPKAKVLRADSDTLHHPEQMRSLLASMRERKADILLGTQSVVKGLDLPGVTLAAVLVADVGLSLPHFRAGERIFQLLTQLTGRSGRMIPGEVIIQTFRPEAAEIVAASQHRTEDYLEAERKLRETLQYPPLTQMIRFILSDNRPETRARAFHQALLNAIDRAKVKATATVAPTLLSGGKIWHVLLRGEHLRQLLPGLPLENIVVDVDPMDVL